MTAATLVIAAFLALCALCAVVNGRAQKSRETTPTIPGPRVPDYDANEAAFDAMGVKR